MINQMCRPRIKSSGEYLIGYASDEVYYVENTPEQISAFIMKYQYDRVVITNYFDEYLITTNMGFIDYCSDQEYLKELLPVLVPMQLYEVEIPEFIPFVPED